MNPTQDEKLMAGLAHGAIILSFFGAILSVIIWVTQKDKSEFVREQAMQAIGWQIAQVVMWFVGMGCYMLSFFGMFGLTAVAGPEGMGNGFPIFFTLPFASMACMMVFFLLFIVVGFYAGIQALQGNPFTYPLIGNRIKLFMTEKEVE